MTRDSQVLPTPLVIMTCTTSYLIHWLAIPYFHNPAWAIIQYWAQWCDMACAAFPWGCCKRLPQRQTKTTAKPDRTDHYLTCPLTACLIQPVHWQPASFNLSTDSLPHSICPLTACLIQPVHWQTDNKQQIRIQYKSISTDTDMLPTALYRPTQDRTENERKAPDTRRVQW